MLILLSHAILYRGLHSSAARSAAAKAISCVFVVQQRDSRTCSRPSDGLHGLIEHDLLLMLLILIDTGAVRSLIDDHTARDLKLPIIPNLTRNSKPLLSANGNEVKTTGHVLVELYLRGLKVEHRMEVAKNLSPPFILGIDFLSINQAGIDYAIKPPMFTLFDGLIELPFYTCCSTNNCVTLARNVCIPAYTEAYVQVNTPTRYNNQDVLIEQTPRALSVTVAKALATCKNNKALCRLLNMNPYMVTLKKRLKLAKAAGLVDSVATMQLCQPLSTDNNSDMTHTTACAMRHRPHTSINSTSTCISRSGEVTDVGMAYSSPAVNHSDLDSFHTAYGFKLSPQLDEAQRYEVLEQLYRYKTVFARDMTEIKLCKGEPLKLELHSNRKMFKRQYRLSEPDKVEMDRQIQQMEKSGVIERASTSYYNSPTYLVMKKNGQKRMVVDLHGVNSFIIPKLVQLPQIEELSFRDGNILKTSITNHYGHIIGILLGPIG